MLSKYQKGPPDSYLAYWLSAPPPPPPACTHDVIKLVQCNELVTVTLPPPPGRRVPHRNCSTGKGGVALEASRNMETGQVASRVVPIPGPMADQGTRAAMVRSPPPPIFMGRSLPGGRSGNVDARVRSGSEDGSGVDSVSS